MTRCCGTFFVERLYLLTAEEAPIVNDLLRKYGKSRHEVERERVHTAILKACGGDITRVKPLVAQAKKDFREVLLLGESPDLLLAIRDGQFNAHDFRSGTYKSIHDSDLRSYGLWLLRYAVPG